MIYLIGSLRNPQIPTIAAQLRSALGQEVFDDWYAAGPEADDYWRDYERARGRTLAEALQGLAARNVYAFDRRNLERAEAVVLVLPAGKSGHLELGWALGQGKRGYILLDSDPDRYDVMYQFADGVYNTVEELINELTTHSGADRSTADVPSADIVREIWHSYDGVSFAPVQHAPSCCCIGCLGDCWNH